MMAALVVMLGFLSTASYAGPIIESARKPIAKPGDKPALESLPAVKAAADHFSAGRLDLARTALTEARTVRPDLPPADLMLARMMLRAGRLTDALSLLESVAVDAAGEPELYATFGEIALRQGRLTDAGLQYDKALTVTSVTWDDARTNEFQYEVALRRAEIAVRRGQWDTARDLYQAAVKLDGTRTAARLALAETLLRGGNVEAAEIELQNARAIDATLPPPERTIADLFAALNKQPEADLWFGKLLARPDVTAESRLARAHYFFVTDRIDEADKAMAPVPATGESAAERAFLAGLIARSRGKFAEAATIFQTAFAADPTNVAVADQLALCLIESTNEAERSKALTLATDNVRRAGETSQTLATLGWVTFKLGDISRAKEIFAAVTKSGRTDAQTAYYLSEILRADGQAAEADRLRDAALSSSEPLIGRTQLRATVVSPPLK